MGATLPDPGIREAAEEHRQTPGSDPRAIEHQLSNGLIESTNTKIRLITRMAYGFHSADALITLALLNLGGRHEIQHSPDGTFALSEGPWSLRTSCHSLLEFDPNPADADR